MEFNKVTWYSKIAALILFIALPFAGFYAGMKYQEKITTPVQNNTAKSDPQTSNRSATDSSQVSNKVIVNSDRVSFVSVNINGDLNYSGTVTVPTPCHEIIHKVVESGESVRIEVTTQNPSPGTVCIQVISEKSFEGQAKVSSKAKIGLYLNGELIK